MLKIFPSVYCHRNMFSLALQSSAFAIHQFSYYLNTKIKSNDDSIDAIDLDIKHGN